MITTIRFINTLRVSATAMALFATAYSEYKSQPVTLPAGGGT